MTGGYGHESRKRLVALALVGTLMVLVVPAASANDFIIQDHEDSPLFVANGTTGNIGIGLLGPSDDLEVAGGSTLGGTLDMSNQDITGIDELSGFFSAPGEESCPAGQFVQQIGDDGEYECATPDAADSQAFVNITGDTMTGDLNMSEHAINNLSAINQHGTTLQIESALTMDENDISSVGMLSATSVSVTDPITDDNISEDLTIDEFGDIDPAAIDDDIAGDQIGYDEGVLGVDLASLGAGEGIEGSDYDGTEERDWSIEWDDFEDLDTDGAVEDNVVDDGVLDNEDSFTMTGLTVTGDGFATTFEDSVRVEGDLDIMGDVTQTDVEQLNVTGDILPPEAHDGAFDLGDTDQRWNNLHLASDIHIDGTVDDVNVGNPDEGIEIDDESDGYTLTLEGDTLFLDDDGLRVADEGIDSAQLGSVAGNGLTGGDGDDLAVDAEDGTINVETEGISVGEDSIDTVHLADQAVDEDQLAFDAVNASHLQSMGCTDDQALIWDDQEGWTCTDSDDLGDPDQDLEDVLSENNEAGEHDIDMTGSDIIDAGLVDGVNLSDPGDAIITDEDDGYTIDVDETTIRIDEEDGELHVEEVGSGEIADDAVGADELVDAYETGSAYDDTFVNRSGDDMTGNLTMGWNEITEVDAVHLGSEFEIKEQDGTMCMGDEC